MNTEKIILRNTEKINNDGTIELIQQETDTFLFTSDVEIKNVRTTDKTVEHLKIYYENAAGEKEQDWLQFRKSTSYGHKELKIEIIKKSAWSSFKLAMIDSKKDQEDFEIAFDLVSEEILQVL
jgi:hypothetical protein